MAAAALLASGPTAPAAAVDTEPDRFELHRTALAHEQLGETARAIDDFATACAKGLAPSCTMAGLAKLDRATGTGSLMDAAQDLAAGCLAGSDFACMKMGRALGAVSALSKGTEGFVAIALLQMGEECRAAANGTACYDAAALLRAEERGGADMRAVQRYAAAACAREAYPGCLPVAAPAADEEMTLERASAHCLSARADGCINLLEVVLKDAEGSSASGALTALQHACDAQIGIACANLGLFYSNGPAGARDEGAARRYMRAGCDGSVAQACFAFAVMHKKGVGGPVNQPRALALVDHACDLGWAKACETLATIVENGEAPFRADHNPDVLRRRACRLGSDEACSAGVPAPIPPTSKARQFVP